jgi:alpha-glucosidase
MYVSKFPSPENYRSSPLSGGPVESSWYRRDDSILALTISDGRWDSHDGLLDFRPEGREGYRMLEPAVLPESPDPEALPGIFPAIDEEGNLVISWNGEKLLQFEDFGLSGQEGRSWILNFRYTPDYRFFGLGEKNGPPEHSGRQTTFWNTDVMGDFPWQWIETGHPDPLYISIPYVLVKCGDNGWLGVFLDSMYRSYMSLGANPHIELLENLGLDPQFWIAAEDGNPRLHFIAGDRPADVTRAFQKLLGVHERPPLWSLGHHQSRWGYGSRKDLEEIREKYETHKVPNDGLWLDIDYMDGYRVFTFDNDKFPSVHSDLEALQAEGQYVVPILDPGVKRDPGYAVYNEGVDQQLFCRNSVGGEYVGYVWPGETVFPDFSLESARKWWASHVARMIQLGIRGFWVDMNDPSTGNADPREMRFRGGSMPHEYFHNSYALGMQMATHLGFQNAAPDLRPFILSRSGSPGTSRYAAVWLGDNISNYHHLAQTLVTGMNLGLSGIAFWGADVPGFGGDADGQLMSDWYKAAFLQPFLRNHSCAGTADQEPWRFGPAVRNTVAHYIRLRYRFLPYLYNLFIDHELDGDPVLTPLWYHFPESFDETRNIPDQFMVGPAVMQAPAVARGAKKRRLFLPRGWWYDAAEGRWLKGDRWTSASFDERSTGLYFKENRAIPLLSRMPKNNRTDPSDIELHVFLRRKSKKSIRGRYATDDGLTRGYSRGNQTSIEYTIMAQGDNLEVYLEHRLQGHGPVRLSFVLYDDFHRVVLHSSSGKLHGKELSVKSAAQQFSGGTIELLKSKSFVFNLR